MQLPPVASTSPVALPVAAMAAPVVAPSARWSGPSAPTAPLAVEGAQDGVARLASIEPAPSALRTVPVNQVAGTLAPPIVDFPGIVAGDVFDIVKGSKAGSIGVRGEAVVNRLDPDHANFHVVAGRFGVKVDVEVDIEQIAPDQVRIRAHGEGIPDTVAIGRVVEARTNHVVFEQVDDPTNRTMIHHDGAGNITIDAQIPTIGAAHLLLERR